MIPNCQRLTFVPKSITVLVDSRERYPVLFPASVRVAHPAILGKKCLVKVKTKVIPLETGDYCLEGFETCCVIERKGSQRELFKNFFDPHDKARTGKALRRLSAVEHPYLMLEVSPASLLSTYDVPLGLQAEDLCNRLATAIAKYNLSTIWTSKSNSATSRRALGTTLVHLMLGHVLREVSPSPYEEERVVPDEGSSQTIDSAPL